MPDWSYQTLFRPLLFRLPPRIAREVTLQTMGTLSKLPWGSFIIRTLGHMEYDPILERNPWGFVMKSPVGLSGNVDARGTAHKAMAQFGLGFIEIGPITTLRIICDQPIVMDLQKEAIFYPNSLENQGIDLHINRLERKPEHRLPLMFRIRHSPGSSPDEALKEQQMLMNRLYEFAACYYIDSIDVDWNLDETVSFMQKLIEPVIDHQNGHLARPLFLYLPLDYPLGNLEQLLNRLDLSKWQGVVIGDSIKVGAGEWIGSAGKSLCIEKVQKVRQLCGRKFAIIAKAGVHQPQDALDLLHEGADLLQLHSGLIYAGPGLPKRINEAIIYEQIQLKEAPTPALFWSHWGWMCLLGLSMFIGGILAWLIAVTLVVLPYDETFLGIGRSLLLQVNRHLLPFMSHDRVTLAGTMISIGIIYYQLAKYGLRYQQHWARTAILSSCMVGFPSFFLFLGYGYFDPLHAIVAIILLPLFILSMRGDTSFPPREQPNLLNDRVWLNAQWGQLMFVTLGISLAIGGLMISFVGVTHVFVPSDLAFLQTNTATLTEANPNLIPLIAHDRAGFGGALISDAIVILISALWGIGEGKRWLWWTLLLSGFPGFLAVFSIHLAIGYVDLWHLFPAYFAFILYLLGLVLLYPYMAKARIRHPQKFDSIQ